MISKWGQKGYLLVRAVSYQIERKGPQFYFAISKGQPPVKKNVFFRALPKLPLPPSPRFGQLVPLFSHVKNNLLARITEPNNDDYDNDGSDICDHNFGTFHDFGVKNDQKVSHNMILMSKYKGQLNDEKG